MIRKYRIKRLSEEGWLSDVPELYSRRAPGNTCISALQKQKNGEEIAKIIEKRSVEILVDPYREKCALSSSEIQDFLNYPEKLQNSEPSWLREWRIKRGEFVKAV